MFWFLLIISLLGSIYWFLIRPHSYWSRIGVIQGKPSLLLGDMGKFILRSRSLAELSQDLYNISPDARYIGLYQFLHPVLLIKDPDLIKQITIKDFNYFLNHREFVSNDIDPLIGRTLFSLKDEKWREMRSKASPSFTSSKMKYMFSLLSKCGQKFIQNFLEKNDDVIEVEMKEIVTKFGNDTIASVIFGVECNSMKEPKNEFYEKGREATDFTSFRKMVVFMGYIIIPNLFKACGVTFLPDKINKYFSRIINENIESREKCELIRPDMISVLLEARKEIKQNEETPILPDTGYATAQESEVNTKSKKLLVTNEDIISQSFAFLFAGFDTVATLICFMAYELAVNPDIQEKLIQEVDSVKEKFGNEVSYEAITTMKYMDMVVSETLRKWPNLVYIDRVCTKPYSIKPKNPDEKPIYINQDDVILIPVYGIHRDPKFYPEPERFDPERFNEENKKKILPCTYLPFGSGPRNCIGSRFALLEAKIYFYYLLSYFEIVPISKTQIPFKFNKKAMNMAPENGFWMGLKRRT